MYLRYLAKYYNEKTEKEGLGFFWAADYLQKHSPNVVREHKELDELIYWFDHKLPIPDYYQDEKNRQLAKSATSWFKDSAHECISRMNKLAKILEANHVQVERIHAKKLHGKKIYEDEFQVTLLPYRDIADQVR